MHGVRRLSFDRELIFNPLCTGAMRVDANISISPAQAHSTNESMLSSIFVQRTEVKNINSMRFLSRAIDYEINRQIGMIERGQLVGNETRTFDAGTGRTIPMRDKEIVQDYRYMPEPNLPVVRVWDSSIERRVPVNGVDVSKLRLFQQQEQHQHASTDASDSLNDSNLPVTIARRRQLINQFGLRRDGAFLIGDSDKFYEYFMCAVNEPDMQYRSMPKSVMDVLFVQFVGMLQEMNIEPENSTALEACPIQTWQFTRVVKLAEDLLLSKHNVRTYLRHVYTTADTTLDPREYAEKNNLLQINDREELRTICAKVLSDQRDLVQQIVTAADGQRKSLKPLYDAVTKETNGRGNRRFVEEIVKESVRVLQKANKS